MAVIGAILGDISGSQYEFESVEGRDPDTCELFTEKCMFTDDTVMTLAVKSAVDNHRDYREEMLRIGKMYPYCGYGGMFFNWLFGSKAGEAYGSYGNGSAMRVSYIGESYEDPDQVKIEAAKSAEVSHNHPEGIKGAIVIATCVWMARHGKTKQEIYDYVLSEYPPEVYKYSGKTIVELCRTYEEDVSCMTSIPAAARCFYESDSYIGFLRNIYRFRNDSDTFGAMFGGVAEECFGGTGLKNEKLMEFYLDEMLRVIVSGEETTIRV